MHRREDIAATNPNSYRYILQQRQQEMEAKQPDPLPIKKAAAKPQSIEKQVETIRNRYSRHR